MKRNARRRWTFVVMTLIVGALLLGALLLPSLSSNDQSLLARSHKINGANSVFGAAHWISDSELLCLVPTAKNKSVVFNSWAVNANTGQRRLLGSLPQVGYQFGTDECGSVSPDSKWTVMVPNSGGSCVVSRLDGTRSLSVPSNPRRAIGRFANFGKTIAWLPDSSGWAELNEGPGRAGFVRIHRFGTKNTVDTRLGRLTGYYDLLGVTRDGRAILRRGAQPDVISVDLARGSSSTIVLVSQSAFAPQTDVEEAVLSPDGTRILWKTRDFVGVNVLTGLAGQITHHPMPRRTSLWISDLNGKNLHALGHERFEGNGRGVYGLRWKPDGKKISFVQETALGEPGQLYEMPVN